MRVTECSGLGAQSCRSPHRATTQPLHLTRQPPTVWPALPNASPQPTVHLPHQPPLTLSTLFP